MAVQLHFEVPFKDDLFYTFIVIILTVVGVQSCVCCSVCLLVDLIFFPSVHWLVRFCMRVCRDVNVRLPDVGSRQ